MSSTVVSSRIVPCNGSRTRIDVLGQRAIPRNIGSRGGVIVAEIGDGVERKPLHQHTQILFKFERSVGIGPHLHVLPRIVEHLHGVFRIGLGLVVAESAVLVTDRIFVGGLAPYALPQSSGIGAHSALLPDDHVDIGTDHCRRGYLKVEITAYVDSLEIVLGNISLPEIPTAENISVVEIRKESVIFHEFGTAADIHTGLVRPSELFERFALPVHIGIEIGIGTRTEFFQFVHRRNIGPQLGFGSQRIFNGEVPRHTPLVRR